MNAVLPFRERSSFIEKAVEDKLKKVRRKKTINYAQTMQKLAGSISAKSHPEWIDVDSIVNWVNEGRSHSNRDYSYIPYGKNK